VSSHTTAADSADAAALICLSRSREQHRPTVLYMYIYTHELRLLYSAQSIRDANIEYFYTSGTFAHITA